MNALHCLRPTRRRCAVLAAVVSIATASSFAGTPAVAVFSKTVNGYTRPNRAETYVFADGGRLPGSVADRSIDDLKFPQVAGVVAASLKRQNYVQTSDVKAADLLIFVSFGTTTGVDETDYQRSMGSLGNDYANLSLRTENISGGPNSRMSNAPIINDSNTTGVALDTQRISNDLGDFWGIDGSLNQIALANEQRYQANRMNAEILGYDKEWADTNVMRPYLSTARDVLQEIEESRYFVVLKAYDFQSLRQHKEKKLLWVTRYSIPRAGFRFDEQVVDMTRYASQFFGQNVDRLIRRHLPEGRVEVGTPVVVPTSTK